MSERSQREDEILEAIYVEREAGRDAAADVLAAAMSGAGEGAAHAPGAGAEDLSALGAAGLVALVDDRVALTADGERRARDVVRRHRLTERLFRDLLAAGDDLMEAQACEFEHILSPEATDSVCTLLGHPPTCPHGKPIPPGPCCNAFERTVRPLVTGLPGFPIGATGRIVFIAPKFHDRMDRLAALGVIPGSTLRLHQRSPSFVIEVGETTIALDPEIANEVYVKPV
ncbi:MAG TPA: metal-dependent transcriptional regulator [Anaeromyxobacter sp.]|nr:metal-dependent transcriptional regulator [Anaeromyxobacter sp.]